MPVYWITCLCMSCVDCKSRIESFGKSALLCRDDLLLYVFVWSVFLLFLFSLYDLVNKVVDNLVLHEVYLLVVDIEIFAVLLTAIFMHVWHRHFAVVFTKRSEERRKAREEKIKPTRPRNEMLTKLERTLHQRRAERRKLEAELQIGQEASVAWQWVDQLSDKTVTFSLPNCQLHQRACKSLNSSFGYIE